MAKSSINVQPIKMTSERHNRREMKLDYVREDLTEKNQSWETDSISSRLEEIKIKYEKSVKQKMQKKATPIREGVFLIKPETTLGECARLAGAIEDRFGIRTFQIHLHRDEGHYDEKKEWKPNLHGHFVFDWTHKDTGKAIRLNKQDMAEMQTLTAKFLGMERGKSSDKKHLSSLQYKNAAQGEMNISLEAKLSDLRALTAKASSRNTKLGEMLTNNLKLIKRADEENQVKLRKLLGKELAESTKLLQEQADVMEAARVQLEKLDKESAELKNNISRKAQEPKKDLPKRGGGMSR